MEWMFPNSHATGYPSRHWLSRFFEIYSPE
jgi:hypothetical protein